MNQMFVTSLQPDNLREKNRSALSSLQFQNRPYGRPRHMPQSGLQLGFGQYVSQSCETDCQATSQLTFNIQTFNTFGDKTLTSLGCLTLGLWPIWGRILQSLFGLMLGAATAEVTMPKWFNFEWFEGTLTTKSSHGFGPKLIVPHIFLGDQHSLFRWSPGYESFDP